MFCYLPFSIAFFFCTSCGALVKAVIFGLLVDVECSTLAIACCMLKFFISSWRSGLRDVGNKVFWKFRACSFSYFVLPGLEPIRGECLTGAGSPKPLPRATMLV